VLRELARASDARRRETTTVDALASGLDDDERAVASHLDDLAACDLARARDDGRVRVTTTGEDLLALDLDEPVVIDPVPDDRRE